MATTTGTLRVGSRPSRATGGHDTLYKDIVGASPKMQRIFRLVSKIAPTDSTVLLIGESGTGKELVARSLHLQSRRAQGAFVAVNVGALPETLIESELFGYVRGAFTGAAAERVGLIEEADRGTLFLDEIGEMPVSMQVKLLRVLETNEIRRLGDSTTRLVDLRVISATNRDLRAEVAAGRFREDLYYRLNVIQIDLPPLRERREDVGLLASYFLQRTAERQGRSGLAFAPEAMAILERYDYPGNVRELENAIEHAATLAEGKTIRAADLPSALRASRLLPTHEEVSSGAGAGTGGRQANADETSTGLPARALHLPPGFGERDTWSLSQLEKDHIQRVLALHRGNATAAARQLGISRTTLWRKLRQYGLKRTAR